MQSPVFKLKDWQFVFKEKLNVQTPSLRIYPLMHMLQFPEGPAAMQLMISIFKQLLLER
jgi:hypothetical protein